MRLNYYVWIGIIGLLVFYHFNIECLADKKDEVYETWRKQEHAKMKKNCYTNIDSAKMHIEKLIDAAKTNHDPIRQLMYIIWGCNCLSNNYEVREYQDFLDRGVNLITRISQNEHQLSKKEKEKLDKYTKQINVYAIDYYNIIGDEAAIKSIAAPLSKSIKKSSLIKQEDYDILVSAYMYLGVLYLKQGACRQAATYLTYAEKYIGKLDQKEKKYGMLYKHWASYYEAMNNDEQAEEYYKKAIKANKGAEIPNRIKTSYIALIGFYLKRDFFEKSLLLLDSAEVYFKEEESLFEQFTLLKGLTYISNNSRVSGKKYVDKAFRLYEHNELTDHVFFISHLFRTARFLLEKGEIEDALQYYNKANQKWIFVKNEMPLFNESVDIFKEQKELLIFFHQQQVNNNTLPPNYPTKRTLLNQAVSSIKCIDNLKIYLTAPATKSRLIRETHSLYELAVKLYYELQTEHLEFADSILYVMEKSKNAFLVEHLNQISVLKSIGVDEKTINDFNILQAESTKKKNVLLKVKDKAQQDSLLADIESIDHAIKIMQAQFEQEYPTYQQLMNPDIPSIKSLKSYIGSEEEVILQYMVTGASVYAIAIDKDNVEVFLLSQTEGLDSLCHQLERAIINEIDTMYARTSHQLYQQLFQSIEEQMSFDSNFQKIRIIPDMEIGFIPFEALTRTHNQQVQDYSKYDYLIRDYEFVYDLSAVFIAMRNQSNQQSKKEMEYDYVAFAPTSFKRAEQKQLPILAHSARSVKKYAKNWNKKQLFINEDAIKAKFKEVCNKGQILELVTHAEGKGRNLARLEFYDDAMLSDELWGLDLQSILVILTACETGTGVLQQGEGIKSLGRAFSQAGATAVMDTYWKTNDKQTLTLMGYFHEALAQGESKATALRTAKLAVLQQDPNIIPRHWAAFKLTGDDTIISGTDKASFLTFTPFLLCGLSLVFLSLIWYNKRKVAI